MKIGTYGNANNYPFMLVRALRRLGHEMLFLVTSREELNRPEHRYADVPHSYLNWLHDIGHPFRWHCLVPGLGRAAVIAKLNSCDAVILNEGGPALAGFLTVPHGVLSSGSNIEILANPSLADSLGLAPFIIWHEQMTQRKVISQFRQSDIVLEQFGASAIGMAGLNARATGRPVIAHSRPEIFQRLTGLPPPSYQARTPEEICRQLQSLAGSLAAREAFGLAGRAYAVTFLSAESAARACLARLGA